MPLNDVPLASQTLAVTQPLIRGNFSTINTAFNVNHVDFSLADAGKHKWVTFPLQGSLPSFLAGEYGLYNLASSTGNNLHAHIITNAGTKEIPFTQSTLQLSTPTAGQAGWTQLPSGMIWITGNTTGNGYTIVTLTNPVITQILMVTVSPYIIIDGGSVVDPNIAVTLAGIGGAANPALAANRFAVYVSSRTSTGAVSGPFSFNIMAY